MKKVAFVVQRCGKKINGGAELLCRQMAQRMSKNWQTEILTTCALDYMTWENYYPMGIEEDGGTIIRRFSVDAPRNINVFNSYSKKICNNLERATLEEQEYWMSLQGPISTPLFDYIKQNKDNYDTFIFFTYLYATTYFLLPIVREKAWLVPAAHNEWPIYMSMWNDFFAKPQGFIFNSFGERDFLKKRFPKAKLEGTVAGIGIEPPKNINPERFRDNFSLKDPFLLYLGRIDESKGCRELFDYFIELKRYVHYPLKLILLGKSVIKIPDHPDIISLGFVDDQTKWDAIGCCEWLINPSPYESLSIVLLEAWAIGKPVLVTEKCDVLCGQCRRANGGLWYRNFEEFKYIIMKIENAQKDKLGSQGKKYVLENYSWQIIEEKYLKTIMNIEYL